ncbi:MAG: Rieske 2Fe-2S domain-containing protein [Thermoplasmataceae archaeon]
MTDREEIDSGKRNFLKMMIVLSAGAAAAGALKGVVQDIIAPVSGLTSFPTLTIVNTTGLPLNTSDLKVNNPIITVFYYPLQDDPNFLLRLGDSSNTDIRINSSNVLVPASGKTFSSPDGVGPYGSVVAFSAICQHLGCVPPIIHYYPPSTKSEISDLPSNATSPAYIHCGCHGSTYDPYHGAAVTTGPTARPLPNVILDYDPTTDNYKVKSMVGPTIYGKPNDLEGGTAFPTGTTTTPIVLLGSGV